MAMSIGVASALAIIFVWLTLPYQMIRKTTVTNVGGVT
jgi:hypothetical protein